MCATLLAALAVCAAQEAASSTPTVHHMSDLGSVDAIYYAPQEWNISCMSNDTISMEVMHPVSGYALTADGVSLQPGKVNVTCPSSGALTLLYEPYDGHNHTVTVTWSPLIPPPPPTVHTMPVNGSIDANYSTSQEWAISCTPHHPMAMTVQHTVPGRSSLTIDGKSLYNIGVEWRLGCPSSGIISMLYTSHDHDSHRVEVSWSPLTTPVPSTLSPPQDTPVPPSTAVPTWVPSTMAPVRRVPSTEVHSMSDEDSASGSYSTPQKWRIACTPSTNLDVTVVQVPGQLTADTVSLGRGQTSVPCPHPGQVTLSYIPSGVNQMLSMRWVPEEQAASEKPEEGGSGSALSSLVIGLIATAVVLMCGAVAVCVYCWCRGRGADPKAYSSHVQCQEYSNIGYTGGLQDSCLSPAGQQPMGEIGSAADAEEQPCV